MNSNHHSHNAATVVRGILLAILGFALFSVQDVLIKLLSKELSVFQIIFFGMIFNILPLTFYIALHPNAGEVVIRSPKLMLLRTLAMVITMPAAFYAFSVLPMQIVYAILFSAPIFITLLAIPVLGERIHVFRITALLIGFVGILVVLRPSIDSLTLGHGAALLAAFFIALGAILNRKLGDVENKVSLVIYPVMASIVVSGLFMIGSYQPMTGQQLIMTMLVGVLSLAAQTLIVLAYYKAPAVAVAPFQYSQMFWAILFGAWLFNDATDQWTWIGTALIILSGMIILYRESRSRSSQRPLSGTRQFRGMSTALVTIEDSTDDQSSATATETSER